MKSAMEVGTKMKSAMELATEVEEANEMKTVMELPTEWICEKSSDLNLKKSLLKVENELVCVLGRRNWNSLNNGSSKGNGFCN